MAWALSLGLAALARQSGSQMIRIMVELLVGVAGLLPDANLAVALGVPLSSVRRESAGARPR